MKTQCPKCLQIYQVGQRMNPDRICNSCLGFDLKKELQKIIDIRLKMYSDTQYGKGELKKLIKRI